MATPAPTPTPPPSKPATPAVYTHTGLTVRSLARSTHLFSDLLGLPVQRTARLSPPLSTVVGHPQAAMDIAILDLGSGHQLELLEYVAPQPADEPAGAAAVPVPWVTNSFHFCFIVDDLSATVERLRAATWQGESMGWRVLAEPQRLLAGPNKGRRVCYMRDDDGLVLEFFGREEEEDGR